VAVSGSILREFVKLSISSIDKAMCELFVGAFFFAMRSCEYLKVQGYRKTKLLSIKNSISSKTTLQYLILAVIYILQIAFQLPLKLKNVIQKTVQSHNIIQVILSYVL
jgi:hypothetical protein